MTFSNRPVLLDCTLRDGSYAVNFQFTKRDTIRLCQALEQSGLQMIEIGHGLGLGASSPAHGIAFEEDEVYLQAASETLTRAKWGAFFIPGIGTMEDLERAATFEMDFVRIGAEVEEFKAMIPFIERANELEMFVCANLMKTYSVVPERVAEVTRELGSAGAECVYVVDSAGCMLPHDVSEYVAQAVDSSDAMIGFHGHNNLDLANANCLAALSAGAGIVDGTVRGMGRSAGNAQTEVLAHLMCRSGYSSGIDPFQLFESGERIIRPLNVQSQGLPPLDIVIGMARFHTSHLPRLRRAASEHSVDLARLVMNVSAVDCVNPSDELVEKSAQELRANRMAEE